MTTIKNLESVEITLTAYDFYAICKALKSQFNALTTGKEQYDADTITSICKTLPKIMQAEKIAFNHSNLKKGVIDLTLFKEVEN